MYEILISHRLRSSLRTLLLNMHLAVLPKLENLYNSSFLCRHQGRSRSPPGRRAMGYPCTVMRQQRQSTFQLGLFVLDVFSEQPDLHWDPGRSIHSNVSLSL